MAVEEGARPAIEADLPRLVELAASAIAELRQGRGGVVWAQHGAREEPLEAGLADELAQPDHHLVVGTLDGTIMGYAAAHVVALPDGARLGVITDLYTEPGVRELGVGEAMMHDVIGWCTEAGCFGVDSLALPGDRHTKNFFESFGLVARAIIVHRSLP